MADRPLLLDLFCGAGGASMGYHSAGFDVIGVDIRPQPRYPFRFIQGDAIRPPIRLEAFDAIHASPPCQAFTTARVIHGREHADLLTPMRETLKKWGTRWVIENVPGAPMRPDFDLCGTQFPGHESENGGLVRHRWFETGWGHFEMRRTCRHPKKTISVFGHGGHVYHGADDWRKVMKIDWMSRDELAQAIPPAYTEFIGRQLIAACREWSTA